MIRRLEVLKETMIANPVRNKRLEKVMSTLEKRQLDTAAVAHLVVGEGVALDILA